MNRDITAFPGLGAGMTLRDYFAAKAMQAFLTGLNEDQYSADGIAIMAYQIADSMLKERNHD
jgi:hypothetical protein